MALLPIQYIEFNTLNRQQTSWQLRIALEGLQTLIARTNPERLPGVCTYSITLQSQLSNFHKLCDTTIFPLLTEPPHTDNDTISHYLSVYDDTPVFENTTHVKFHTVPAPVFFPEVEQHHSNALHSLIRSLAHSSGLWDR